MRGSSLLLPGIAGSLGAPGRGEGGGERCPLPDPDVRRDGTERQAVGCASLHPPYAAEGSRLGMTGRRRWALPDGRGSDPCGTPGELNARGSDPCETPRELKLAARSVRDGSL